jgi:hypothetical protein
MKFSSVHVSLRRHVFVVGAAKKRSWGTRRQHCLATEHC